MNWRPEDASDRRIMAMAEHVHLLQQVGHAGLHLHLNAEFPEAPFSERFAAIEIADDATMFYMHLYKCAGTSLITALQHAVGADRFINLTEAALIRRHPGPWQNALVNARPQRAPLPFRSLVAGDFEWGIHHKHGLAPNYAVMLREPIERAWSAICYFGNLERQARDTWGMDASVWADPIALIGAGEPMLCNYMTRQMAGGLSPDEPVTEEEFDAALEHLKDATWVGVVEQEPDLEALARMLDVEDLSMPRLNVGYSPTIEPAIRSALIKANGFDLRLYAAATV